MRVSQCSLSNLERERGDRIAGVAFHVSSFLPILLPIPVLETAITSLQLRRNAIQDRVDDDHPLNMDPDFELQFMTVVAFFSFVPI